MSFFDLDGTPSINMADASHYAYGGPSTAHSSGHSSPDMESLAGSPVAYNASLGTAPTALRFIDAGANISLELRGSCLCPTCQQDSPSAYTE
jgi:hypothetical protein